jgi:chemotaxis protein MotB
VKTPRQSSSNGKRLSKAAGHHGGAWKVAYADFVTAMMAFFLLMWLLNATTEKADAKGLADYFSPTIPISRTSGGGDDEFRRRQCILRRASCAKRRWCQQQAPHRRAAGARRERAGNHVREKHRSGSAQQVEGANTETGVETPETLKEVEALLLGRAGESTVSQDLNRHVRTRITDEGLIIEVFDLEGAELFAADTATPQPLLVELAALIASVSTLVKNRVAVEGHTRAQPLVLADRPVWALSTERANVMRALLQDKGVDYRRVARVTGHADQEPVVRNPLAIRNNRLEVILLRRQVGRK